jgi:hypothetical protein
VGIVGGDGINGRTIKTTRSPDTFAKLRTRGMARTVGTGKAAKRTLT